MSRGSPFVAVLPTLIALSCVQEAPRKEASEETPSIAVWDFSGEPSQPQVSLWPRAPGAPERKKRHLATESVEGRLEVRADGADPCLLWRFVTPIHAATFRVDAVAEEPGRLQLFWSTPGCPTFSETCSASVMLERGQNVVGFLLDRSTPIRELRLDLPEKLGTRLAFTSISFSSGPGLDTGWVGRDTSEVSVEREGLVLTTAEPDPWLIVATPGLDASRVGSVEVTMRGATGAAQLYWDGPCGVFAEACSVMLERADAGAATHRALLSSKEWRGEVHHLRFDPGPAPGQYGIESITLGPSPALGPDRTDKTPRPADP